MMSDTHTTRNEPALFFYQWLGYIYNLYRINITGTYPCKFEVVYVTGVDTSQPITQINFERNVTNINSAELFTFIDRPTGQPTDMDAVVGLFFPFSKIGPFPRLHQLTNTDKSFTLNFSLPTGYGLLTQHLPQTPGIIPVADGRANSFFCYGYNGFTIPNGYQSPNYKTGNVTLVQYDQSAGRTSSMAYIKEFRVTSSGEIYMTQVGNGELIYRSGDVITIEDTRFNVLGKNVILLDSTGDFFERFDYQLQPVSGNFIENYANNIYFTNYIKYNKVDRIIPSFYNTAGTYTFILNIEYSINNPDVINYVPSLLTSPYAPLPVATDESILNVSFLQDPTKKISDTDNPSLIPNFGDFIRLTNAGGLTLSTIYRINIDGKSVVTANEVIGKPHGQMSFAGGISNSYDSMI